MIILVNAEKPSASVLTVTELEEAAEPRLKLIELSLGEVLVGEELEQVCTLVGEEENKKPCYFEKEPEVVVFVEPTKKNWSGVLCIWPPSRL